MSDSNRDIRDINVALINAAKRGDTNEVKRLISEGADVNEVDTKEMVGALLQVQGINVNQAQ